MTVVDSDIELRELGRFFEIAKSRDEHDEHTSMFSERVDRAWHGLLKQPERYAEFSMEHAGQVLGHEPDSGNGIVPWIGEYEQRFGPLPSVWFADADGLVDTVAEQRYRSSGEVVASWKCRPVPPKTSPKIVDGR